MPSSSSILLPLSQQEQQHQQQQQEFGQSLKMATSRDLLEIGIEVTPKFLKNSTSINGPEMASSTSPSSPQLSQYPTDRSRHQWASFPRPFQYRQQQKMRMRRGEEVHGDCEDGSGSPYQGEGVTRSGPTTTTTTHYVLSSLPSSLHHRYDQSVTTKAVSVATSKTVTSAAIEVLAHRRESIVGGEQAVTTADIQNIFRDDNQLSTVSAKQIERVRMMHAKFLDGCRPSFNYNMLLFVASCLAALGLASNNSATIIASMLVSPIMGPVVGIAYGATINDPNMVKIALRTECVSLAVCIGIGGLIGFCTGWTDLAHDWPTAEMTIRGDWQSLLVGLPVAFFSGLGVAVSLLDDQTSSLVGVAISASLLPPAVNAGLLWVSTVFVKGEIEEEHQLDDDAEEYLHHLFREAGGVSLLLTIANVILIIVSSMLVMRIKERLPIQKRVFWDDLGVARKIYRNLATPETDSDEDDDDDLHQNENNDGNDVDLENNNRFQKSDNNKHNINDGGHASHKFCVGETTGGGVFETVITTRNDEPTPSSAPKFGEF
mmetsp:Transcript_11177/g.26489  ORF Transcript_11177/g.26489 Transcript_11177/m.26489 type:complete len:545 (+) Transcript_11177:51-1685(+)